MLEGQPNITDPRIAQLLQRLQSTRERWHQRGYEDGIGWAVELAHRAELEGVDITLAEPDGRQLAEFFQMRGKLSVKTQFAPTPTPPHVLHLQPPMSAGQAASGTVLPPPIPHAKAMPAMPSGSENVFYHRVGIPFPGFPESFHPAERLQYWQDQDRERSREAPQGEATRIEVDESAYLEGWRDAVKGIWQVIAPALS